MKEKSLKEMVGDLIALKMTQKEIADAIGRSQPYICELAREGAKRPTLETVERLRNFHARAMKRAQKAA